MIDFSKVLEEKSAEELAQKKAQWAPSANDLKQEEICRRLASCLNEVGIPCKFRPIELVEAEIDGTDRFKYFRPASILTEDGKSVLTEWYRLTITWEESGTSWRTRKPNGKARIYVDRIGGGRKSIYRMNGDGHFRYSDIALELKAQREVQKSQEVRYSQKSANLTRIQRLQQAYGISQYSSEIKLEPTDSADKPLTLTFTGVMTEARACHIIELLSGAGYVTLSKKED